MARDAKVDLPDRTFSFACAIVELCRELDRTPGVSRTLARQLVRAGTSIGANVEEGQAGQSRADFISKLAIACKEARETNYWLRLIRASHPVLAKRIDPLVDESSQLTAILTSIVKRSRANATRN